MKDELFLRGENVPMTKEAVRALALSKLELHRASHLIDVGAGTGSVSIEAALQFPSLQVTAIERNPAALRLLDENRQRFACGNIDILPGEAPMTITGKADAVFMGGSGGHLTALIDWAMGHLHPGGRLVMTFILQENLHSALAHLAHIGACRTETFDPRCVWFVGAGPGDCELITLKGYRLLQQAQVVIYAGSLINTELLDYCPAQAERYDSAELHLEQIIELMAAGVKAGKTVVRLQTGDVSLYGSVREQGEELTRRGIDWQVVPGVSAFLGAAAELGVEYTVPEVSQSLIITRLEGRTPVPAREQLEAFASHQTSMAIYLSVQRIHRVAERLIAGGYPATTPVAVIYKATWPESQTVRGTLADISDKVRDAGIRKTALILVGNFLGKEYHYSRLYAADFSHEYRKA